jgi:hypothetical protein
VHTPHTSHFTTATPKLTPVTHGHYFTILEGFTVARIFFGGCGFGKSGPLLSQEVGLDQSFVTVMLQPTPPSGGGEWDLYETDIASTFTVRFGESKMYKIWGHWACWVRAYF